MLDDLWAILIYLIKLIKHKHMDEKHITLKTQAILLLSRLKLNRFKYKQNLYEGVCRLI